MAWIDECESPSGLRLGVDLDDRSALAIGPVGSFESLLTDAEAAYVAGAVASRRREFATGRRLAKRALAHLGVPATQLLRREDRSPIWPDGVCGSISHCSHFAVGAASTRWRSVGVDVECAHRLSPPIYDSLFTPDELAAAGGAEPALTALFSAKEAVFKAIFPITGEFANFTDAEIGLDLDRGLFEARYLGPPGANALMTKLRGFVSATPSHVLTLAILD
jgi:4'-phosphopantetheinyl transferase EntD